MYSICYVLVDNEVLDFYAEMIISICSLRKNGYAGEIYVLTEEKTNNNLISKKKELEQFEAKVLIIDVPNELDQRLKSRYIKTLIRKVIRGSFLYLDVDTIISGTLPQEISEYEIAMVLDVHNKIGDMPVDIQNYHFVRNGKCGFTLSKDQEYFNSGVMWVKDTEVTYQLFAEWHRKWMEYTKKKVYEDQPGLNQTNVEMGYVIKKLPDIYNVQVSGNPFPLQHLVEAKVIHYTNNPYSLYLLADKSIRMQGLESMTVKGIIDTPKKAFLQGTFIKRDDAVDGIKKTYQYSLIMLLYSNHPKLFVLGEKIIQYVFRLKNRLNKLKK